MLIRVTAVILNIMTHKSFNCDAINVTSDDLSDALNYWIKFVQVEIMDEWSNRFKRLAPSLRDDGVITVGNRISSWLKNNFDRNYLILLPAKSEFSTLVVRHFHNINHDGIDTTVARIRSEYWIPNVHRLAKRVRKSCYRCRIQDKILCKQQMGRLPEE